MVATREYLDGDVIFREGEGAGSCFILMEGTVELRKDGRDGGLTLARLAKGELFGEMGVLDNSPRSATAVASGSVTVQEISRKEFRLLLDQDPDMVRHVIGNLVQRLRRADDMLAERASSSGSDSGRGLPALADDGAPTDGAPTDGAMNGSPRRGGWLSRLLDRWRRKPPQPAEPQVKPFVVLVAPLEGDAEGRGRDLVNDVLSGIPQVQVKSTGKSPVSADTTDPAKRLSQAAINGRQALASDNADLLVWGGLDPSGRMLSLHFITPRPAEDERPGLVTPALGLPMPPSLEDAAGGPEDWPGLLRAVALAALEPVAPGQAPLVREMLAQAVAQAAMFTTATGGLTGETLASVHIGYGNALATLAFLEGNTEHYRAACEAYGRALQGLPRYSDDLWAATQRLQAIALQNLGDRAGDKQALKTAAESYRAAMEVFSRPQVPLEWAALQARLGMTLYKLNLQDGSADTLKQALAAYQQALAVYSRETTPVRWTETMANLAQALQLYGDHESSPEVLERAADACRGVLEMRPRETMPTAWASTQNNLGSALFLLAKHAGSAEALEESQVAFEAAMEVYLERRAVKTVRVIERNLERVETLKRRLKGRKVADMHWEGRNGDDADDD